MEMYYYIGKNRGAIAVNIDTNSILRKFRFTKKNASLKKAVESSIEKCIATDLVDELLKSDVSVLFEIYYILHQIAQQHVAKWFCNECPNPDKEYYAYTLAHHECKEPISCDAKMHQNINTIVKIMAQCNDEQFCQFMSYFWDNDQAISRWHNYRITNLFDRHKKHEAIKLLLTLITNKYQYDQLKLRCADFYPEVLPYL